MKPVIRYLIVCIVMAIFVGIVVYFLLNTTPPAVVGSCGTGNCKEVIDPAIGNNNLANVINEHSIITNPVKIESDNDEEDDDEDVPDIVELTDEFVPPVEALASLSSFMQKLQQNDKEVISSNQTVIEEIDDDSSESEEKIISCGELHELANQVVEMFDKQEVINATEDETTPIVEETIVKLPPPTPPKRRGRPKAKKEQEIATVLAPPAEELESIKE